MNMKIYLELEEKQQQITGAWSPFLMGHPKPRGPYGSHEGFLTEIRLRSAPMTPHPAWPALTRPHGSVSMINPALCVLQGLGCCPAYICKE